MQERKRLLTHEINTIVTQNPLTCEIYSANNIAVCIIKIHMIKITTLRIVIITKIAAPVVAVVPRPGDKSGAYDAID